MAGPDGADPFSRDRPLAGDDGVSGQSQARRSAQRAIDLLRRQASRRKPMARRSKRWTALGATLVEFDLEPFYETARLLYEGPWVAERYLVIRDLLASSPDVDPSGDARDHRGRRAADRRRHLCRALSAAGAAPRRRARASPISTRIVLPTAPTAYSTAQVLANPIELNCQARHLHQFRQPARPLRAGAAGGDARRRHSVRHHAAGARRQRRAARQHRPRLPCRHQTDDRRANACRSRRSRALPASAPATRSPSPWSARICPAWR